MGWNEKVTCGACGTEFKIDLKVKPLKGGGEQHFFRCPNKRCRKRYVVANITPKGVELRFQIQRVREELPQADEARRAELLIDLSGLQKQLEPEVSKG